MKDIARFLSGFKNFQRTYFSDGNTLYAEIAHKQSPKALVIACSDSRVDPAILMNCEPGDIFVVRNVANLVPPYEDAAGHHGVSAALEYAVKALEVEHVIVLGHSCCGGIQALMSPDRAGLGEFIGPWVSIAEQALRESGDTLPGKSQDMRQRACELAAILVSIDNLLTFPWVRERIERQTLHVHAWYFDMAKGELLAYLPKTKSFETIISRKGL